MSAFWKIHPNRKSKREKDYGLVKGGLTPTFPRKQSPVEVTPGESEENVRRNQNDKPLEGSSTRRPLMTQSTLQARLPRWEITPGLLGVTNHGNTCFMNTVIQSLSNTDLFSEYFVRKKFKELLNTKGIAKRLVSAPKGEVTEALGSLLENIWSGEYTPDFSSHFKNVVSKYNSQYKGSSQHDAQEFLLWLLDRINEELHQSQKKKAKESTLKSKKDKQVEATAESSPEVVLSMSSGFEIYNKFQALYQSSLTCPNCGEHSNTYETYLCLSLPVPQKCLRPVFMTVVYLDDSPKQLRIALQMNSLDTVKDLRDKLAYELDVPPKRLVLCQIYDDGFRNTYGDDQLLSDIHESENVYVFETHPFSDISKAQQSYESELIQILLVHVEKGPSSKYYRFCTPQILRIPRDIKYATLQKYILRSMGLAVSEEDVEQCASLDPQHPIFDIRVVDSGVSDCYLSTEVEMPLYTQAIDRAISMYAEGFGPPHVKFVVEWEPRMKERIVLNDEDDFEEHQSVHKVRLSQQQPTHVSLDECLRLFTKEEMLGEGDAWNCPGCNKEQQGTIKKLGLWSTPDILVIHLKRFRHLGAKRNKLNILVNFPVNDLEMGAHILPQVDGNHDNSKFSDLYDLYAVSNHYGNMNGGHYTAFCKNPVDSQWYEFDDTHVKPLDQRDIVSRAAYLLFYQRKKLVNNTVNALQSGTHWVMSVYGPPQEISSRRSPEVESRKHGDSEKIDRDRVERDRVDYVDAGSNGHRYDDYYESLKVDLNSPRREERDLSAEINSPRQSSRSGVGSSPRKQLFDSSGSKAYSSDTLKKQNERTRVTVAEQIVQSKASVPHKVIHTEPGIQPHPNGVRLDPQFSEYGGDLRVNMHNSGCVDTSEPAYSRSSSSSTNHSSNPPSPQYEAVMNHKAQNSSGNTVRTDNRPPLPGTVLNNARDIHTNASNSSSSSVKLKVHSNQIHSDEANSKGAKKDTNKMEDVMSKVKNQKNMNVSNGSKISSAGSAFSTPQQGRRSPPQPTRNSRGFWSTPQPQRKQYTIAESTNTRPTMDRQLSFPTRSRPVSDYDMKSLTIEGIRVFDDQPQSLPTDVNAVLEKPPRPKPSQASNRSGSSKSSDYEHSRPLPPRPSSSHPAPRAPANNDYIRPSSAKDGLPSHSVENHVYEMDSHRPAQKIVEEKPKTRSTDRHNDTYSHNTRGRPERPLSCHQSSYNDYHDQYYLSQPIDPSNFERTSRYATVRPGRTIDLPADTYLDNEIHRIQRQTSYQRATQPDLAQMQQPRSRAPLHYSPHRYQDSGMDFPRYQPHLHQANFMTKLAIQEREYLNRKMKSQCLKESSV